MQQTKTKLGEIKLIGICVRTSYLQEVEEEEQLILNCTRRYFFEGLQNLIPNRKKPGVTICAYTAYEPDHTGAYNFFIGEEVTELPTTSLPNRMIPLVIPPQDYVKFTTLPGPIQTAAEKARQRIQEMTPVQLGGNRQYLVDFEVFDERANNPDRAVMDLYVGIQTGV
jgi:predicted transcriptional regulator YdeE